MLKALTKFLEKKALEPLNPFVNLQGLAQSTVDLIAAGSPASVSTGVF